MISFIKNYFKKRADKKARIKAKTESLINDYEKLLNEYRLIQEKKSKLSYNQRQFVVSRVLYLIKKGHFKVNSNSK